MRSCFFFFNDTATTEIYTLSLHDALPICSAHILTTVERITHHAGRRGSSLLVERPRADSDDDQKRSEEHTSELQSRQYLVCRLLLEKKKNITSTTNIKHPYRRLTMITSCS